MDLNHLVLERWKAYVLKKRYKLVGTEMSIEYAAFESGLDRFVHLNKGNFIGSRFSLLNGSKMVLKTKW
jgi:Glycine cleavage system T protein (aminomethyltransferase)